MTRKLYRHKVTGVETMLDDQGLITVFGDRFELVDPDKPKRATRKKTSTEGSATGDASTNSDADASSNSDSSKEGNK